MSVILLTATPPLQDMHNPFAQAEPQSTGVAGMFPLERDADKSESKHHVHDQPGHEHTPEDAVAPEEPLEP